MGFFDKIFGNNEDAINEESIWHKLQNVEEYREAVNDSFQKPVLFFKHSTTCFISKTVKKNLEKQINQSNDEDKVMLYYLDLLSFRPISNLMANDLNVRHESPQAILIKNGEVKYNASHDNIDFQDIIKALN